MVHRKQGVALLRATLDGTIPTSVQWFPRESHLSDSEENGAIRRELNEQLLSGSH